MLWSSFTQTNLVRAALSSADTPEVFWSILAILCVVAVDPREASVEQIARALDFLIFHQKDRLEMEKEAHQRGFQMQWNNVAWALLQHIKFIREENELVIGRAEKFTRDKASIYHD